MTSNTHSRHRLPVSRRSLVLGLAFTVLAGCKYGISGEQGNTGGGAGNVADLRALRKGAMARLIVPGERRDVGHLVLVDGKGREHRLSEWKGRVLLVNFWATWCFPCRKEMPEIAALQEAFPRKDFLVIAASEDKKGYQWAREGLVELKADNLHLLMDEGARALRALGERGLPTTILVDRKGRLAAKLIGPAEWNSEEARAVVRALLAEK
jgi:thiol-disulfide isomerase/thioredoxin